MNGMESVRDLLSGAEKDPQIWNAMHWTPPHEPPPADHEETNP